MFCSPCQNNKEIVNTKPVRQTGPNPSILIFPIRFLFLQVVVKLPRMTDKRLIFKDKSFALNVHNHWLTSFSLWARPCLPTFRSVCRARPGLVFGVHL